MESTTTIYHSPLGILEVTAENESITSLSFSDEKILQQHDQPESVVPNVVKECEKQLDEYFASKRKLFDLQLKPAGTDFQKKVWELLSAIPYGKTISYLELSKLFGNTLAIRAIGSANGKNPIALIIPCHRVIGNDGKLVGYAGKIWRKQWLLEHEGAIVNKQQSLFPQHVG